MYETLSLRYRHDSLTVPAPVSHRPDSFRRPPVLRERPKAEWSPRRMGPHDEHRRLCWLRAEPSEHEVHPHARPFFVAYQLYAEPRSLAALLTSRGATHRMAP